MVQFLSDLDEWLRQKEITLVNRTEDTLEKLDISKPVSLP